MSAVPQHHLLHVLTRMCNEVAKDRPLVKHYDKELFKHLVEIVALERAHLAQPSHIQRQISDKVDTLSQIIFGDGEVIAK